MNMQQINDLQVIKDIPTEDELNMREEFADMHVMASDEDVDDEDVSYLAELCDDNNMDACMRNLLLQYNDDTGSKSAEELYLKQVIMGNNKTLEGLAKRQMEYEQQWKEQKTSADVL